MRMGNWMSCGQQDWNGFTLYSFQSFIVSSCTSF